MSSWAATTPMVVARWGIRGAPGWGVLGWGLAELGRAGLGLGFYLFALHDSHVTSCQLWRWHVVTLVS